MNKIFSPIFLTAFLVAVVSCGEKERFGVVQPTNPGNDMSQQTLATRGTGDFKVESRDTVPEVMGQILDTSKLWSGSCESAIVDPSIPADKRLLGFRDVLQFAEPDTLRIITLKYRQDDCAEVDLNPPTVRQFTYVAADGDDDHNSALAQDLLVANQYEIPRNVILLKVVDTAGSAGRILLEHKAGNIVYIRFNIEDWMVRLFPERFIDQSAVLKYLAPWKNPALDLPRKTAYTKLWALSPTNTEDTKMIKQKLSAMAGPGHGPVTTAM